MKTLEQGYTPQEYCEDELLKIIKRLQNLDFTIREWDELINAVDDFKELVDNIDEGAKE